MRKALIILLILLLGFILFIAYQNKQELNLDKFQKPTATTHPVLIIDYDGDKKLSQEELLDSEDAVLLVTTSEKDKMDLSDNLFNSVAALQNMDLTEDYKVDPEEDIYKNFNLMFFENQGKDRKYLSLKQAKINELVFYQTAIKNLTQISAGKGDNLVGYAIEGKGKHREKFEIRVLPVTIK